MLAPKLRSWSKVAGAVEYWVLNTEYWVLSTECHPTLAPSVSAQPFPFLQPSSMFLPKEEIISCTLFFFLFNIADSFPELLVIVAWMSYYLAPDSVLCLLSFSQVDCCSLWIAVYLPILCLNSSMDSSFAHWPSGITYHWLLSSTSGHFYLPLSHHCLSDGKMTLLI